MGFLLMYDITNLDSFNAVQDWSVIHACASLPYMCIEKVKSCRYAHIALRATQIKTYSWDNAQVILVGNKCDLEDDRLIPTEDSQRLAHELGERKHVLAFLPI